MIRRRVEPERQRDGETERLGDLENERLEEGKKETGEVEEIRRFGNELIN